MNKSLPFAAARFAPRFFQVRRGTWIGVGVGLMVLTGLLIWAALALMGWFLGQVQAWNAAAPEAARGALATVEQQVEQVAPGIREKVAAVEFILTPADRPRRDVSGTDFAPVARYPGLARTFWHREGKRVAVHYEGRADYAAVLDHYLQGFASLGYTQETQSAAPEAETHVWIKGKKRYVAKIASEPKGMVSVDIETTLD
ncbi:MAG TPA: hypothetical protein PLW81_14310 [Thiobacillaceae bacterium]|nr:hypothetical protein [Thiobacillaceae bacterium]